MERAEERKFASRGLAETDEERAIFLLGAEWADNTMVQKACMWLRDKCFLTEWRIEQFRREVLGIEEKGKLIDWAEIRIRDIQIAESKPLNTRIQNGCRAMGIYTLGDLASKEKASLLRQWTIGWKSIQAINKYFMDNYNFIW